MKVISSSVTICCIIESRATDFWRFSYRPFVYSHTQFPTISHSHTEKITNFNFSKSTKRKGGEKGEETGTEGKGAERSDEGRIICAGEKSEIGAIDVDL